MENKLQNFDVCKFLRKNVLSGVRIHENIYDFSESWIPRESGEVNWMKLYVNNYFLM